MPRGIQVLRYQLKGEELILVLSDGLLDVPGQQRVMQNIPSYYCHKLAYGPAVKRAIKSFNLTSNWIDQPLAETLSHGRTVTSSWAKSAGILYR